MPNVSHTRSIAASPWELWKVISDPHHLPRWWPRVSRVEAVDENAFTEVLMSARGKVVRADFKLVEVQEMRRIVWSQQLENTPFARVLKSAETEIALSGGDGGEGGTTEVTIELRQSLRGLDWGARMGAFWGGGGPLVRRAASATIEEALDGLERIVGRSL